MEIEISKLRAIFEKLMSHLEKRSRSVIVDEDFYWVIPKEFKYDVYKEPTEFGIGQLTDDWQEMEKVLNGQHDPIAYDLVWFAAVVAAIGEKEVR